MRKPTLSRLTDGEFFDCVFDATGKRQGDERRLRLCRAWRRLCARQHRARHDLVFRPRVSQARDDAAQQPQRDARRISRRLGRAARRAASRRARSTRIAPARARRPKCLRDGSSRRPASSKRSSRSRRDVLPHSSVRHEPLSSGACRSVRQRGAGAEARRRARSPSSRRRRRPTAADAWRSSTRRGPIACMSSGLAEGAVIDEWVEVSSIGRRPRRQSRNGTSSKTALRRTRRDGSSPTPAIAATSSTGRCAGRARSRARSPPNSPNFCSARYRAGGAPLTLLPCELIVGNGDKLQAIVLGARAGTGVFAHSFRQWVASDCLWVNSLVDRIVSEPLEPAGAVAEPYALWAVERQPGLAMPCAHPAIVLTDDLARYERLKLFILNLGHTYLAGRLGGARRRQIPDGARAARRAWRARRPQRSL